MTRIDCAPDCDARTACTETGHRTQPVRLVPDPQPAQTPLRMPGKHEGACVTRIDTESELDALPIGSIVLEADTGPFLNIPTIPGVFHRFPREVWGDSDGWFVVAGHGGRKNAEIALPATLLFVPGRDLVQEAKANAFDEALDAAYVASGIAVPNPYRDEAL